MRDERADVSATEFGAPGPGRVPPGYSRLPLNRTRGGAVRWSVDDEAGRVDFAHLLLALATRLGAVVEVRRAGVHYVVRCVAGPDAGVPGAELGVATFTLCADGAAHLEAASGEVLEAVVGYGLFPEDVEVLGLVSQRARGG